MLQPAPLLRINTAVSERPFHRSEFYLKAIFPSIIYSELLILREGNTDYKYTATDTFLEVLLLVKYCVKQEAD